MDPMGLIRHLETGLSRQETQCGGWKWENSSMRADIKSTEEHGGKKKTLRNKTTYGEFVLSLCPYHDFFLQKFIELL